MAAPRVEVEISGKATGFAAEFKKISAQATEAGSKIKSAFSSIQGAAAALGVGLSVAGFTAFIKGAIDAADKLNDLSKITGVSAKTIGGIGFAAQQAGSDVDGAAKAFGKLNITIADALAGNREAIATFSKLGISLADLRSNSSSEIFAKLADAFSQFEDGANKAAGANAIFGKSYQSVLPLLDEGGQSLRKNIGYFERYSGVTDDLVRASDQFNDSLTKLGLLNRAFGNQLANVLLPSMQKLAEYLVDAKEKGDEFKGAAEGIGEGLKVVAKFAIASAFAIKDFGEFLGSVAAQAAALGNLQFSRVAEIGDEFDARMERSKQRLLEYKKIFDAVAVPEFLKDTRGGPGGSSGRRPAPSFGSAGAGAGAGKEKVDEFAKALERVSKLASDAQTELQAAFSGKEISGAQKALNALVTSDEWKKFTEPQKQELTSRYASIDAIQRDTAAWKLQREEVEKQIRALQEVEQEEQQAKRAFTATLGQYAEENDYLEKSIKLIGQDDAARDRLIETMNKEALAKQGLLAKDDAGLAILDEQFRKRIALIDQLAASTQRFGEVQQYNAIFADAFADSLADIVEGTKGLKEAFEDMARSIVQSINRIAAQKLADALFGVGTNGGPGDMFAKLFGGSGGSGGGFDWSKLIQMAIGVMFGGTPASSVPGSFTGPSFGTFAVGTNYVPRDMFARIHKGEQIVPAKYNPNRPGGNGGAVSVTINQTFSGQVSTVSSRQAATQAGDAVARALKRR